MMKTIFSLLCLYFLLYGVVDGYNVNNERLFKDTIQKTVKTENGENLSVEVAKPTPYRKKRERFEGPRKYWFNSRIHTFGNTGLFGGFHAAMAPLATYLIDTLAYDGENVRNEIAIKLRQHHIQKSKTKIVDMCCGVGTSTRALESAFHDASSLAAIDTSPEMVAMAIFLRDQARGKRMREEECCDVNYYIANAEKTNLPGGCHDLVTIMYALHEVPYLGRYRILREARRLLAPGATLAIVDISPSYEPSPSMLAGEPYVLEYKKNIQEQLKAIQGFVNCEYTEIVDGHVGQWLLKRREE